MMAMGVPYDLYWSGDPFAVRAYMEAFQLKQEWQQDELDAKAWLTGAYVHEAVSVVMSQAFGKGKNTRYPKEPYGQTRRKKLNREVAVMAAFNEMRQLAAVYNARKKNSALDGRDSAQET